MVWREGGKGWYGEGVRGGIERRGLGVVWREGGKGWYGEKGGMERGVRGGMERRG